MRPRRPRRWRYANGIRGFASYWTWVTAGDVILVPSKRPDERAIRFFGERRSVRRRLPPLEWTSFDDALAHG